MTAPQAEKDPAVVGTLPVPEVAPAQPAAVPVAPAPAPPKIPTCAPNEGLAELTDVFQRLQSARKRRLFVLVEQGQQGITNETLEHVYEWKAEIKAAAADAASGGLDILLHSPGGGLSWCYQIARLLSSQVDEWEALVPDMASSGATLITLGSANIVMGDMAHLGPIDPQVLSKHEKRMFASERQSPLEAFEAVGYLRQFALTSVVANMHFFLSARIAPKPALEAASNLAYHMVQPILSKIEPYDLGAFALDSRLSLQYCGRIAEPTNAAKRTQRNANYRSLVEKYPAHEFIIDIEEARALGFKVCEPEQSVALLFDEVRTKLDKTETETYIGLVPEPARQP